MSEELTTTTSTDLETPEGLEAAEAALAAQSRAKLTDFGAVTPRIALRQAMSKGVPDGIALGEFYNTITGINYGTAIEFLTIDAVKGRFLGSKRSPDGRSHGAVGPVVPDHWPEQYRGKVFADLPEAHERYSEAVNAGEIQWDKGPAIQDSFNFTGFITRAGDEPVEPFPVLFSIIASNSGDRKAASKAGTLLRALPNFWSKSLLFSSDEAQNASKDEYYVVSCDGYGSEPTDAQRRACIEAALFSQQIGFIDPETVPRAEGAGDTANETDVVVPKSKGADF